MNYFDKCVRIPSVFLGMGMFKSNLAYIDEYARTSGGFPDAERIHIIYFNKCVRIPRVFLGMDVFETNLAYIDEHARTSGGFPDASVLTLRDDRRKA
jgi:hypothetical protein